MPIPFQLWRGDTAERTAATPLAGELFFDTDVDSLYIGDGVTVGGIPVGGTISTLVIVSNKTTNFSILGVESSTRYTNNGAGGTVVGSLPAATIGLSFGFSVATAQTLRADAAGTDTINWAGTVSAAGGVIEANVVGSFVLLECHVTGEWTVTQSQGGWTVT